METWSTSHGVVAYARLRYRYAQPCSTLWSCLYTFLSFSSPTVRFTRLIPIRRSGRPHSHMIVLARIALPPFTQSQTTRSVRSFLTRLTISFPPFTVSRLTRKMSGCTRSCCVPDEAFLRCSIDIHQVQVIDAARPWFGVPFLFGVRQHHSV